jgi:hypothetical protein
MLWSLILSLPSLALAEQILSISCRRCSTPMPGTHRGATSGAGCGRSFQLAITSSAHDRGGRVIAHAAMPALPWVACFLLGAIVADRHRRGAVGARALAHAARHRDPRRREPVNDATARLGTGLATAVVMRACSRPARSVPPARIAGSAWRSARGRRLVRRRVEPARARDRDLFALSLLAPYLAPPWRSTRVRPGASVVIAGFVASGACTISRRRAASRSMRRGPISRTCSTR